MSIAKMFNETEQESLENELGKMIKASPDAVKMIITPDMARAMLERNSSDEWSNRPESSNAIKRYARRMSNGEWVYTGQTIIFSESGNLLNGQHTLSACVVSGEPIESLVAFGVSDDAFKFMDCGVSRSAAHIFAIDGIPNYVYAAAASRLLYAYKNTNSNNPKGLRVDNDELLEFFYQNQGILESKHAANVAQKQGLLSPAWAGFLHYICAQKNRSMADEFFERVLTGIGIDDPKSPENILRSRLIKNTQSKSDDSEAPIYIGAYVIKAWNAKRKGGTIGVLKWRTSTNPTENFPRAV